MLSSLIMLLTTIAMYWHYFYCGGVKIYCGIVSCIDN